MLCRQWHNPFQSRYLKSKNNQPTSLANTQSTSEITLTQTEEKQCFFEKTLEELNYNEKQREAILSESKNKFENF